MSKQVNYNENLVAGAAIRDDKGRRISKLFEASHPKMTVGYAKNLIMPDDPTEQEFNFRQSGGGVIEDGVAVIDKVKGNSVVWNQLIKNGNFASTEGWVEYGATISISKGEATITQTVAGDSGVGQKVNAIAGHKIMILMDVKEVASMYVGVFRSQYDNIGFQSASNTKLIQSVGFVSFFTTIAELGDYKSYIFGFARGGENSFIKVSLVNLIDLTQMFGAGNEPATYEEFLSRKPKVADEYAYNEGTIVSNKVEAIKTSGVNLWDEQWEQGSLDAKGLPVKATASIRSKEFNRCLPNCEICFSCQSAAAKLIYWYDVNKAFISRYEIPNSASIYGVTTSPANAYFFKVRNDKSTYNNDICINVSDPAINGQYFPYEKHELDLSWVKEIKDAEGVKLFEDGMKSAGTAFDEVTKNKAVKRLGSVDLGTLPWNTSWWDGDGRLYVNLENKKVGRKNIVYPLGPNYEHDGALINTIGICGNNGNNYIYVGDAKTHSSASEFISSLSGVYAYYELAEPIEVEYDEKSLTYPVVAVGTEEAIASEPSSAFRADIGYGIDAVKTILDLKARVEALEGK